MLLLIIEEVSDPQMKHSMVNFVLTFLLIAVPLNAQVLDEGNVSR